MQRQNETYFLFTLRHSYNFTAFCKSVPRCLLTTIYLSLLLSGNVGCALSREPL